MKRPLLDQTTADLASWMAEHGFPRFHAGQVVRWVFARRAERFEAMSDVPKRLREALESEWSVFTAEPERHSVAPDGTDKLLLKLADGRRVECVLMAEAD